VADKNFHENEKPGSTHFYKYRIFPHAKTCSKIDNFGENYAYQNLYATIFGLDLARELVFIEKSERHPYHLLNFISLFKPL